MKQAVYAGDKVFELRDVPVPEPGEGEVLVKVDYCGICGTDVHGFMYDTVPAGTVLGHEFTGHIAELGKGVTGWRIGDPVVAGGGSGSCRHPGSDRRRAPIQLPYHGLDGYDVFRRRLR